MNGGEGAGELNVDPIEGDHRPVPLAVGLGRADGLGRHAPLGLR